MVIDDEFAISSNDNSEIVLVSCKMLTVYCRHIGPWAKKIRHLSFCEILCSYCDEDDVDLLDCVAMCTCR
jgi:hypothetical protein